MGQQNKTNVLEPVLIVSTHLLHLWKETIYNWYAINQHLVYNCYDVTFVKKITISAKKRQMQIYFLCFLGSVDLYLVDNTKIGQIIDFSSAK